MRRPSGAREALRFRPLVQAGWVHLPNLATAAGLPAHGFPTLPDDERQNH